MNVITLDFETYYDNDYTLSKMTTEEYVRDSRFEVHGVAIRWSDGRTQWYGPDVLLRKVDFENSVVVCHHAHFDGLILSHHYGIHPKQFICTLSMARALIGAHLSKSLEALAEALGIGKKTVPYDLFKGKHWHQLTTWEQQQVANGACDDVLLTWDLLAKLKDAFPAEEYEFVDATVRMFTNPRLVGNTERLAAIWQEEEAAKRTLLAELGVTGADLRKQWKFAELLRAEGIEPEQKLGKPAPDGTPRYLYSFARTDDFMRDLVDHDDDRVAALAQAKLEAHSNGVLTRTNRLGWMSTRGPMCVYLNYAGTHLSGWSGGDKVNWQNFKRGGPIGTAIAAPKGFKLITADASQIECRLLNEIAGQKDKIEDFRLHKDPYAGVASAFYGFPVNKNDHPVEREGGKRVELMSGYGAGGRKIASTLRGLKLKCTDEEGVGWRDAYRATHTFVTALWRQGDDILKKMYSGMELDWHVVHIKDKIIYLPNGFPLLYNTLEWDDEEEGFRMRTTRNGWTHLWGGMLVQQMMQALRSTFIRQAWLECVHAGLDMVSMEHDKLIGIVREHEADAAFNFMTTTLARPPAWLPNIPLDSDGYISDTLAKQEK